MSLRMVLILLAAISLPLSACNGPTKAGIVARKDAHGRMDKVNAQLTFDQAQRSFETGQFSESLRQINASIARYDKLPEFHVLQGRILMEMHKLGAAHAGFLKAVELNDKYHEGYYFLGVVYQRWSNDEKAYEYYRAAYDNDTENIQYLLASAESLIALQQYTAAKELITERSAYFEHNGELRHLLAQIVALQGDHKTAAGLYEEARLLKTDDAQLLYEKAQAEYSAGLYGEAYESLCRTQKSGAPADPSLMHMQARCLQLMGRENEARQVYLRVVRAKPGDSEAWRELGLLAIDIGDIRRLELAGTRLVELRPDEGYGYFFLGLHHLERGVIDEAIRLLNEAMDREGCNVMAGVVLGHLYEGIGDSGKAKDVCALVLEAEPSNVYGKNLYQRLAEVEKVTSVPLQ
ncbi:MAG: hypothetical protein P8J86_11645 [Phycisphaerales bacterium]|nr:hypothetical protein [Phycisphaerales bacterium]